MKKRSPAPNLLGLFRKRRGALLSAWVLLVGLSLAAPKTRADGAVRVAEAVVTGAIDPGSGDFVRTAITKAEKGDYDALVIRLDTPGGLVSTTREIVQAMLDSNVPVLVWVAPSAARAGSAGVFITLAAHVAAMAPATNIGAAHPVSIGGGGGGGGDDEDGKKKARGDDEVMAQKIENDVAAFAEAIAQERGRNVEWAIRAVRDSESIPANRAVELKVVDFIAKDMAELLALADGRTVKLGTARVDHVLRTKGATVETIDWSIKQLFLHFIGDPNVASLLLSLGGLGLLIEFYKPGAIVPGVLGAVCMLLGVIGISALPVNVGGVILLFAGMGLVVAEVFVGAFGLLGIAGAVCLGSGAVLLVDNTGSDFLATPDFGVDPANVWPTSVFVAFVAVFIGYKAVRAWKLKPVVGEHALVGQVGTAEDPIAAGGSGKVFVFGELWNARSATALEKGARVKVVKVDGLTVEVEPADGA